MKHFETMPEIPMNIQVELCQRLPHYLFFETICRGEREYTCSACHEVFRVGERVLEPLLSPEKVALWHADHKGYATCPCCGKEATVINRRKLSGIGRFNEFVCYAVFLPVSYSEVWIRCFALRMRVNTRPCGIVELEEYFRYRITPGNVIFYESDDLKTFVVKEHIREPFVWNHGYWTEKCHYAAIVPNDGLQVKDTFLKYSCFAEYEKKHYWNPQQIKYLCSYAKYPQIELLVKMGQFGVVDSILIDNCACKSYVDWSAKKPWEFYRMPKNVYNVFVNTYRADLDMLKLYHGIKGKTENDLAIVKQMRNTVYSMKDLRRFLTYCRAKKSDPREVFRYIKRVAANSGGGCWHCPGITEREAFQMYLDYMDIAKKNGTQKIVSAMPKDLKAAHDEQVANKRKYELLQKMQSQKDRIDYLKKRAETDAKAYQKKYPGISKIYAAIKKRYEYRGDKYMIVCPKGLTDICFEGEYLNHCIYRADRYYDRIKQHESYLMFLRRVEDPDTPFYTLEVEPGGVVRQKRTFDDTQGEEIVEVVSFLREWQTVLQERLSKADKERAKQSKILRLEGMKELRKNKTIVRTGYLSGKLLADVLEADLIDIIFEEQEEKKEVV